MFYAGLLIGGIGWCFWKADFALALILLNIGLAAMAAGTTINDYMYCGEEYLDELDEGEDSL